MSDLALVMQTDAQNPDVGDLRLENNRLHLTPDQDHAAAQDLYVRLQHFLGEWYQDEREGVPYLRTVFRKGFSRAQAESMFRRAIGSSPHVVEVTKLELTVDKEIRELTVDFSVLRADGAPQDFPAFVIRLE